jgi:hypothetical protein
MAQINRRMITPEIIEANLLKVVRWVTEMEKTIL